jgi:hypothetical protein
MRYGLTLIKRSKPLPHSLPDQFIMVEMAHSQLGRKLLWVLPLLHLQRRSSLDKKCPVAASPSGAQDPHLLR